MSGVNSIYALEQESVGNYHPNFDMITLIPFPELISDDYEVYPAELDGISQISLPPVLGFPVGDFIEPELQINN